MGTNVMVNGFDELVFNGRNQNYGAYYMRKKYNRNLIMGLILSTTLLTAGLCGPIINNLFKDKKEDLIVKNVEITLKNPDSIKKEKVVEVIKSAPKKSELKTIKYTVPIITKEEIEDIITKEDVNVSNPGNITQNGNDVFTDIPDNNGDQLIGDTKTDDIFTVVEKMPEFIGGDDALNKFLGQNLNYPQMAKELGIQGKVWTTFIIDEFGNVTNVEVIRGIGGGCDDEALRVISLMPRWNPGKQGGHNVKVKFNFPINFKLN